jgi:sialidase-1
MNPTLGSFLRRLWPLFAAVTLCAQTAQLLETKTITPMDEPYAGWPTVARRANGELWTVWSGGRDGHVCPLGQVRAMTSNDDGATWTYPRVLFDGPIDDRDSGVLETGKGTLLVTTFTSLAYEESGLLEKQTPARQVRWKSAQDRLTPEERKAQLGEWVLRSTDGGKTWSPPIATLVNSPHGPTQLKDGRLLYVGKKLWKDDGKIGVAESKDDGLTWTWLSEIPVRPGDAVRRGYHELFALETDDGRIVAQIRNHNKPDVGSTLQCESSDGGQTWTVPKSIDVWGLPSHLLKLKDGRFVMTYGYRRPPFGNQARISTDQGRTWSGPLTISADGTAGDLGYPSTVELADGTLLTVWYENMKDLGKAVLRQAKWKVVK